MEQDITGLKESIEAKIGPMMVKNIFLFFQWNYNNIELKKYLFTVFASSFREKRVYDFVIKNGFCHIFVIF